MSAVARRGLGRLLLGLGLVLALGGSARLRRAEGGWQSRPVLPLQGAGAALMLCAVGLLRAPGLRGAEEESAEDGVHARCLRLCAAVRAVHSGLPALSMHEHESRLPPALDLLSGATAPPVGEDTAYLLWLKLQLDPVLDDLFPQVMAGRESFRRRRGLGAFAALFGDLAYAERLLGRAWSASVDGYPEEARDALAAAAGRLDAVERDLVSSRP